MKMKPRRPELVNDLNIIFPDQSRTDNLRKIIPINYIFHYNTVLPLMLNRITNKHILDVLLVYPKEDT